MKKLISKELLSVVLDVVCTDVEFDAHSNDIIYEAFGKSEINIYEFAHKCKEWAFDKGYSIISWQNTKSVYFADIRQNGNMIVQCEKADSEPEAIFQTCQWVLDNKDKI